MVALPNLQCTTPEDVFLALKASDFILNDLDHAYDDCVPENEGDASAPLYSLVLKKWYAIPPSHEFRCFVLGHRLAGMDTHSICPASRLTPTYNSHLATRHELL
jgi:hypothetical protein